MIINVRKKHHSCKGVVLLEALASAMILSIMITLTLRAYHNRLDTIGDLKIREYASSVAERQMEKLLANQQEPEEAGISQMDEVDPDFSWKLDLERIVVDDDSGSQSKATYKNTLIQATVTVELTDPSSSNFESVERIRYLTFLKGREGNLIGVPLEDDEQPGWYKRIMKPEGPDPPEPPIGPIEKLKEQIRMLKEELAKTTDPQMRRLIESLIEMLEARLAVLLGQ